MSRFNRHPSPTYRAFVEAIQAYADADQKPGEDVRRAIADALEDDLRERFKAAWEVESAAETACFRRLITGEDECTCDRSWGDRERETVGEGDEPPHKPPHSDLATLWFDENDDPTVFSMHVYHPGVQHVSKTAELDPEQRQRNGWFDIVQCAEHWGLEIAVMPVSWYNAFSTNRGRLAGFVMHNYLRNLDHRYRLRDQSCMSKSPPELQLSVCTGCNDREDYVWAASPSSYDSDCGTPRQFTLASVR